MLNCLINWLVGWMNGWLFELRMIWPVKLLNNCFAEWIIGWLNEELAGWINELLAIWKSQWFAVWTINWLIVSKKRTIVCLKDKMIGYSWSNYLLKCLIPILRWTKVCLTQSRIPSFKVFSGPQERVLFVMSVSAFLV